ncbi:MULTISPECIES: ribosomal-processing cysteine protease Prp [unclassified Paenibacillus]|uniref:Ribosomal processing cysteine protease Prp n=1 Tax=Paenibacillus provencensis TaxID=441151 RepID=A0ABW3QG95_9BACL|nr:MULTISPECIES: ribosomal-processing cysteine protease Prp [unclassified Paenibacillus]MCM3129945.1 ribosomal-processing cysteine protease Prp [Paenibacillus sp. MER 78]SFS97383.1 hypothetical protein SAMN04488601_11210 [Paenibacillus sp. 453mf]
MITVHIFRLSDGSIRGFSVKGHANYAKAGEDIVCAGVSAVTVGTANSIETLTGVELDAEMEHGFLSAYVPEGAELSVDIHSQIQLLLESLVVMLKSIVDSYGEYIQIKQHNN